MGKCLWGSQFSIVMNSKVLNLQLIPRCIFISGLVPTGTGAVFNFYCPSRTLLFQNKELRVLQALAQTRVRQVSHSY